MKKLLVLSVLLGLMALPMFASDITFGGDVTFGFIGDFGDNEAEDVTLTTDLKATVDDYNSLVIEYDYEDNIPDKAAVTTDIGAWLGLPIGLTTTWGWDEPDANEFHAISKMENEQVFDFSPDDYFGHQFLLSYEFIEVEVAFNPGVEPAGDLGYLLAGLAVKEPIPGLNAEVYYFQNKSAIDVFDEGSIAFDAAYAGEFSGIGLEAGAGFVYELADAPTYEWQYGVAAAVSYSMIDATLGLDGNDVDALNGLSITAVVAPIDLMDIYAGAYMSFAADDDLATPLTDESEAFQGADLGVNAHIGAVEMYVGYVVTEQNFDKWNAPTALPDGGGYIKFDVDY
jgi:hypothetical protein